MVNIVRVPAAGAVLFVACLSSSALFAADTADACKLLTAADLKKVGISAVPKGRNADSPNQSMQSCTAGSLAAPPMLSLTIQKIKIPIAIEMGRKQLADSSGEVVAGPWDAAKLTTGTDGAQLHYFKGSTSVLVWAAAMRANSPCTMYYTTGPRKLHLPPLGRGADPPRAIPRF